MTTNLSPVAGIPPQKNRQAILAQMDQLAWLLDNSIRIPVINYRIGLDAVIGLIPGLGDAAGLILSSFIVFQALRLGAPGTILTQMLWNIVLEAVVGLVPILGDLFDATFKANVRNVRLIQGVMSQAAAGKPLPRANPKGIIAAVIGVLLGLIVLIGSAGIALFWAFLSWLR
ncbi:MAG: DUF4112 domain-containing protein [Caldilineaceae bacterium]|nr:DUF4112 domain-containing protein [Caldilineaceae bacterium]